jgi:hypothetical protein
VREHDAVVGPELSFAPALHDVPRSNRPHRLPTLQSAA